jgi:hypothetical protein
MPRARRRRTDATSPAAKRMGISDEMFEHARRMQHNEWRQYGRMISLTRIVERLKTADTKNEK